MLSNLPSHHRVRFTTSQHTKICLVPLVWSLSTLDQVLHSGDMEVDVGRGGAWTSKSRLEPVSYVKYCTNITPNELKSHVVY